MFMKTLVTRGLEARRTACGNETVSGVCSLCGKSFTNIRSFYGHARRKHEKEWACFKKSRESSGMILGKIDDYLKKPLQESAGAIEIEGHEDSCLTGPQRALVVMMSRLGISLSSVMREEFVELVTVVGGDANLIPSFSKLRQLTLCLAGEFKERILREMKGRNVTAIIDGSTVCDRTFYSVSYFCERKIYFGNVLKVEVSDHASLAQVLSGPLKELEKAEAVLTSIITDNARNLLTATTPNGLPGPGMHNMQQKTSVQELTGLRCIHISCGIHSSQLILVDLLHENRDFALFKNQVQELMKFLKQKQEKKKLRAMGVVKKIPLIQEVKWLTYYEAFTFLDTNKEVLKEYLAQSAATGIVKEIPEIWIEFLTVLKPLGEFVLQTQGDSVYMWEFRKYQLELISKWEQMGTPLSKRLVELLMKRFKDTADGTLLELSYLLSLKAVDYFVAKFQPLYSWTWRTFGEQKARLQHERDELMMKFIQLSEFWGIKDAHLSVPKLFNAFLANLAPQAEATDDYYRRLMNETYESQGSNGQPVLIKWEGFAVVACRIAQLPATEAVAERVFSHLRQILPGNRYRTGDDMVDAQMTIRMQTIFDRANSRFGWNQE